MALSSAHTFDAFVIRAGNQFAQQDQPSRFKVEGIAINSANGKPLPRVLVTIYGRAVLTGPEGEFAFDRVPAGHVQIEFMKPGYFKPSAGGRAAYGALSTGVEVGPDTGKVVLKLYPEAAIGGRVVGQDEEPLEGVTVEVMTYLWEEGRRILTPVHGARTDEEGEFHIGGLVSGQYILAVKSGNVSRRVLGEQAAKPPVSYPAVVYYPGTMDLSAATAVDLAPGQKMDAQFSLSLMPAYSLAGKVVVLGEWKQVYGPTIIDSQDQMLFRPDKYDGATGAFEFRAVPPGIYTIRVQGSDTHNYGRVSDHKITVSRSVTNLQLALKPGINIPVVGRSELSKPPQVHGSCDWQDPGGPPHHSDCSDYPPARVELISIDSRARFSSNYKPIQDPSDSVVAGVAPGKYIVRAQAGFSGYVQSVRSGSLDLLRDLLTVPEDGNVPPIEVVVRDDPGTLRVAVRSEKAGQTAVVVFREGELVPSNHLIQIVHGAVGNVEGYFGSLAPGNYKVLAFDSFDGLSLDDPGLLAKFASQASNVTVTANSTAAVTVDVLRNGELTP